MDSRRKEGCLRGCLEFDEELITTCVKRVLRTQVQIRGDALIFTPATCAAISLTNHSTCDQNALHPITSYDIMSPVRPHTT